MWSELRRARGVSVALIAAGVALVALVPASTAVSATSGLVAAYGFEAGSGTVVADSSGNRNDGAIARATWTSGGMYGNALRLDGSGPGAIVDDSSSLHLKQAMTLEAWVKPATVSAAWRDVVYKGDDNYFLEATSTHAGVPAAGGAFPAGDRGATFGTGALSPGTWAYLAATYDRSVLRLYVNGQEVSSLPEDGPIKSSGRSLGIGGDDIYGQAFEGLIDEVRVYEVARTADEIRSDMATPVVEGTRDTDPPSAPGTLSATAVSSGEVDLSWGKASDNVGVTGYEVFRCGGAGCTDFARVAQVDGTAYTDGSVAADSAYSYRVRAVDAAGNSGSFSNDASATTPGSGADKEPPSAPGTLSATAVSSGEVDLSWGKASDNVGVAGYEVFRCGGAGCTDFAQVAQVDGTATAYVDGGVAAGSAYSYRVRAVDSAGNTGSFSNDASATTPAAADKEPPSAPGTLSATAVGSGEVDLSWGAATDESAVVYDVERCAGSGCTDFTALATTAATAYVDSSVAASSTYVYRVRAVDAPGNIGPYSNSAHATTPAPADTDPPSAPGTLSATAVSSGEIDLGWGAATDESALVYDLERCQGAGCTDFSPLATTAATAYVDSSVAADSTYVYRVRAVDAAGNVGPYAASADATTPPAAPVAPGPIGVDPSGRHLVDEHGAPFLMTGDSPQALIGNLTEADAEVYFASRRAEGFNTVWINLLCNSYTGCRADGATWDGVPPFTTPGDFSTPNEAYFAHADRILRLAGQYGLVVILDPAETGGWLNTMVANGVDKLRAYGQFLGSRYKDYPNIIWMHGNDYQSWGPTYDPYVTAVALGIGDVDTRHLQTVQLNYTKSGSLDDAAWAPIIQLNASYQYSTTYQQVLEDYNRSNFLPTFLVEADYEFEQNSAPPGGTPLQLRRQEYWTLLSGGTGQLYGNHYTWQFLCSNRDSSGNCIGGWKDQLSTPGQTQLGYVKALFESRRWYDLVPDQGHTLVTDGLGTYGTVDYVTAARTPDGTLAMAYLPSSRTVTVDLSKLSGPVTARWYDPTTGTFTSISGSPFSNAGTRQFTAPGTHSGADDDWVLVLEAS